jgi:predicted permease
VTDDGTGSDGSDPPEAAPRWWTRLLPDDDWSRAFVDELDDELRRRWGERGIRGRVGRLAQALSPRTWQFIWLMRRRQRPGAGTAGGMTMRTGSGGRWWHGGVQDLRQAGRALLREPRFTGFVVLTLALGLGGVATMFGVADRLFLRSAVGVQAPDALVRLYLRFDEEEGPRLTPWVPYVTGRAIRDVSRGFAGVTLYRYDKWLVQAGGETRPRPVNEVGPRYFDVLGATPRIGRFFGGPEPSDGERVAVIAHRFWLEAFGGDPGVLGRTLAMPGGEHTIVGVAAEGFHGPHLAPVDVWVPLADAEAGNRNWWVLARVRPAPDGDRDASRRAAVDEAQAVHARTDPGRSFQWASGGVVSSAPIRADDAGQEPAEVAIARLLMAVTVVVLLIGTANVTNLFLARLAGRQREVAVRLALGAGRWRLARLLFAETVLVALLAAAASLPLAYVAGEALRGVLLPEVAWTASPLDLRVLALTGGVALLVGALVGLLPLRRAGRSDVADNLRGAGRGTSGRGFRLHSALAASQMALSAALLVGAGLFLRSFHHLRVTDLGFDAEKAVAVTFHALEPGAWRSPSEREHRIYLRALETVRSDPGLDAAAVTLGLPFLYNFGRSVAVPGRDSIPSLPGGGPYLSAVTETYFDAVGTPLVLGRGFTAGEIGGEERVIVVSESMAEQLWPGQDPLGRCVQVGGPADPCWSVVGVARDVHRVGYREPPSMQYYLPLGTPGGFGGLALVLRPRDRAALARLRPTLERVDPLVAYVEMTPLASLLEPQARPWRLGAWVLGMAAALALLVAVSGVYGVLSYLVEQRRREIGVRMALGASRRDIGRLVLRTGLGATALGAGGAAIVVAVGGRRLQPLLFETSVADPVVFTASVGVLAAAAVVACLLPAARAAGVEPTVTLRGE